MRYILIKHIKPESATYKTRTKHNVSNSQNILNYCLQTVFVRMRLRDNKGGDVTRSLTYQLIPDKRNHICITTYIIYVPILNLGQASAGHSKFISVIHNILGRFICSDLLQNRTNNKFENTN